MPFGRSMMSICVYSVGLSQVEDCQTHCVCSPLRDSRPIYVVLVYTWQDLFGLTQINRVRLGWLDAGCWLLMRGVCSVAVSEASVMDQVISFLSPILVFTSHYSLFRVGSAQTLHSFSKTNAPLNLESWPLIIGSCAHRLTLGRGQ